MILRSLKEELGATSYPGRGIVLGKSDDGQYLVMAYFIMAAVKTAATVFLFQTGTV